MHLLLNRVLFPVAIMILLMVPSSFAETPKEPRLITVTGDADVQVVPDEVVLTMGVESLNKDLELAKSENDQVVQRVLAIARKYRIQDKHVQTDHVNIEPRYKNYYERRDFIGYVVRKTIVIKLKDISKFEDLLSDSLQTGVNHVHGIQFRTTELRKYKDQARALAIQAAQEKANDLATELGQALGKPHAIREDHGSWWHWYNSSWGSRYGSNMAQNTIQNVSSPGGSTTEGLALGQIKVNAKVTVSFELE